MELVKGKSVIITGSARGIGRSIAERFIAEGANVVISDVLKDMAEDTAAALGDNAIAVEANVTRPEDVKTLVNKTKEAFGSVDVLINNAGITRDGLFIRMKEEDWNLVIDINLKGTFIASQAAAVVMMKQRSGNIINIASVSGLFGNAGQANYASSKAGIIALTKVTARELSGRGIRVNAIAPGFIQTAMTDKLSEDIRTEYIKQIPLGQMGSVDDVANAALFLASPMSAYITGQTIAVCGGLTMQS